MPRTRKRLINGAGPAPTANKRQKRDADHSPRLSTETVKSALTQLINDANKHEKRRVLNAAGKGKSVADIAENELYVYVVITLKQPPHKPLARPHAIPLKHSIYTAGKDEICFFVKDPQRQIKDYLAENGKGEVTRVMGVEKLRKRYKTHEGRRELLNMYDLFLVDNRVAPMMPNLLGSAFTRAKKMPLAVDMRRNVVTGIRKAMHSTAYAPVQGTSSTMKIGKVDLGVDKLVENVCGAMDVVIKKIEGGWHDVQSVNLKTNKSPALPIYLTMPTPMEVSSKTPNVSGKAQDSTEVSQKEVPGEKPHSMEVPKKEVPREAPDTMKVSKKEVPREAPDNVKVSKKEVPREAPDNMKASKKEVPREAPDNMKVSKKEVPREAPDNMKVSKREVPGEAPDNMKVSQKEEVATELKPLEKGSENGNVKKSRKRRKKQAGKENYAQGKAWGNVN